MLKHISTSIVRSCIFITIIALATGTSQAADNKTSLSIAIPSETAAKVKTSIAEKILTNLGYEVDVYSNVGQAAFMKALGAGETDVALSVWLPQQRTQVAPLEKAGTAKVVTASVENARVGITIPEYVWDAGVHSVRDLNKHKDKFNSEIYGYAGGSGTEEVVTKALNNDVANLGEWSLKRSSTAGMLASVKRAIRHEEWIAFLGWKPHWMNVVYDLRYLEDADLIFQKNGGKATVNTVMNTQFMDEHPNLTKFFKQYKVTSEIQSQWVYQVGFKKKPQKTVVNNWLNDNPGMIREWLDGVKTTDGDPAIDSVPKNFSE